MLVCGFSPEFLSFLKDLGGCLALVTREEKSTTYFIQRLAIAVQRGNAASVQGTAGQMTSSNFFYLYNFSSIILYLFSLHVHVLCFVLFFKPFWFCVIVCIFNGSVSVLVGDQEKADLTTTVI